MNRRSFLLGEPKTLSFAGDDALARTFGVGHLRVAADRELMRCDSVPDRFDARLLGAVARQVDERDVGGLCWLLGSSETSPAIKMHDVRSDQDCPLPHVWP